MEFENTLFDLKQIIQSEQLDEDEIKRLILTLAWINDKTNNELNKFKTEFGKNEKYISKLTGELTSFEEEISKSKPYVSKLEEEISKSKPYVSKLEEEISDKNKMIDSLSTQIQHTIKNERKYSSSRL